MDLKTQLLWLLSVVILTVQNSLLRDLVIQGQVFKPFLLFVLKYPLEVYYLGLNSKNTDFLNMTYHNNWIAIIVSIKKKTQSYGKKESLVG